LVDIMLAGEGDPERLVHARSNRTNRPAYALREGRWKWILHLEDERQELYDLVEDPGEKFDLVAAGSADASRLEYFSAKLGEWLEYGRVDAERAAPVDNRMLDEAMIESLRSLGYIE
jgi:arylsulfatase A-like enzyme